MKLLRAATIQIGGACLLSLTLRFEEKAVHVQGAHQIAACKLLL